MLTCIVDEPDEADDEEAPAVELEDQLVRGLDVAHGLALELLGLLDEEAHDEEDAGEDAADGQRDAPLGAQVLILAGGGNDIYFFASCQQINPFSLVWLTKGQRRKRLTRHESTDDEAYINHAVGEPAKEKSPVSD